MDDNCLAVGMCVAPGGARSTVRYGRGSAPEAIPQPGDVARRHPPERCHGSRCRAVALGYAAVRRCGAALLPRGVHVGLLGGELLETAKANDADLRQMQAAAAGYLDNGYKHNQVILEDAARRATRAIVFLTAEILALAAALLVTLIN